MTSFADRAVDAIADALLGADSETTVALCPACQETLVVYVDQRRTDHLTPICPEWSEYCENWEPATP